VQRRPVLESRDRMRYTPRREATEPRSGECLQWGLFGHVDLVSSFWLSVLEK